MIQEFVDRFMEMKPEIRASFAAKQPWCYMDIVQAVIQAITIEGEYGYPDPNRIHVIDDGHYQGTLVYVIGAQGYQPDDYWFVKVNYGSCSGCDTLQGIKESYWGEDGPSEQQLDDYMTLALHIVQRLKEMN